MHALFPLQFLLGLVTWGLLARWYLSPRLAQMPLRSALQPLLAVQAIRYIGLTFLAPAAVGPSLSPQFAVPAALGTALAGVLGLAAIAALRSRWCVGLLLAWLCAVEGLADFANAFVQAMRADAIPNLGAAYYIPVVIVPAATVSGVMIISLLVRRRREAPG
jgi:hypothetical protein